MGIKLENAQVCIFFGICPHDGIDYRVIPAEGNDARLTLQQISQGKLDLFEGTLTASNLQIADHLPAFNRLQINPLLRPHIGRLAI